MIGNPNTLRANFSAAFGDVAVTNALRVSQLINAIFGIERMHFERGDINQISWPNELFMHAMIAQHVTNILAKKTLDALSKFLNAIDILLLHSPGSIWRIRWSRFEFPDLFLYPEIPRYIRDQIFDHRKNLPGRAKNLRWDGCARIECNR